MLLSRLLHDRPAGARHVGRQRRDGVDRTTAGVREAAQGGGRACEHRQGTHRSPRRLRVWLPLSKRGELWFFLPTIIKNFGVSTFQTNLLAAVPYLFGTVGMLRLGRNFGRTLKRGRTFASPCSSPRS
jgi:hypothetical protein